jgi:DNA-binding transcriptional ArsR family regulator
MTEDVLAAFAEPRRRALLELLQREGECSVTELTAACPDITRPAVSQHLRVLREAGLVTERPDGTRRLYRLSGDGLADLRKLLDHFWTDELHLLADEAEETDRP